MSGENLPKFMPKSNEKSLNNHFGLCIIHKGNVDGPLFFEKVKDKNI